MSLSQPSERAKELFLDAAELPDAERSAFLAEACAGDARLEERVRKLLGAHERAESYLGESAQWVDSGAGSGQAGRFEDELEAGAEIGVYRLLAELGEGGFGSVWLAEQDRPVKRRVALKVLKAGMDTREVVARFEAERQALALMDHPCIAKVFDAGATERGRPFFAMELVDGVPVTEFCDAHGLSTRERLELFLDVCRAVQHAHQKGVIHRDLKPSNVLVSRIDGAAVPKVIDFGVAKAVGAELTEQTLQTRVHQMIGTPAYMSPEQVRGAVDVDTRSDLYSLGVLLYEILSGSTPFDQATSGTNGAGEVFRMIRDVTPPKPSTRLGRTTANGRAPARGRGGVSPRHVRGDLDWIVMCCLEKERDRRYESVATLANDILRHLRGEPVLAGPPALSYRVGKFARRHAIALTVTSLVFVLLAGATVVSTSQSRRARTELGRYEAIAGFLEHMLLSIDPAVAQGKDIELLSQLLNQAAEQVDEDQESPPEVEATIRRVIGGAYMSLALYEEAEQQLKLVLELRESALGEDDPDTVHSREQLGGLYLMTRRFSEAEPLLERAYRQRLEDLGIQHEDTLAVLANLAVLRRFQNRLDEAERMLRQIEEQRLATLGESHEDTVRTMNNLAGVLEDLGRIPEAEDRYRRALEIQKRERGELHLDTLKAYNNLGSLYLEEGRFAEADPLLQRALEIKGQVLPAGHPSYLVTLNNLAKVRSRQDKLADARSLFEDGIALASEHHGEESHYALVLRYGLTNVLVEQEDYEDAESELRDIVMVAREREIDPRLALGAQSELGGLMRTTGRPAEAEVLLEDVIVRAADLLREDDPAHGVYRVRRGLALRDLGRTEEALELLEEGHNFLERTNEEVWKVRALESLIDLLEELGLEEQAARWRARLP